MQHLLSVAEPVIRLDENSRTALGDDRGLEVWALDVSRLGAVELDEQLLDDRERRRAARLNEPRDRRRYAAAHQLLRELLARRMAVSPGEITYARDSCGRCGGPCGRPVVDGTDGLSFSLSMSRSLTLIALSSTPVGVDIEDLPAVGSAGRGISGLIEGMHPRERLELAQAQLDNRPVMFTRLWTRKEAYLKGIGAGIVHGMSHPYVGAGNCPSSPRGWIVSDLAVNDRCAAAVAWRRPDFESRGGPSGSDARGSGEPRA